MLKVTKATLLHALIHYGGPAALAADGQADQRLARWGGSCLSRGQAAAFAPGAQSSVGIRQGEVEQQRLREYATEALNARQQMRRSRPRAGQAGARPAGAASRSAGSGQRHGVCVVGQRWRPGAYECGAAYRKAMGLNLTEYSSGTKQGELHISSRGNPQTRAGCTWRLCGSASRRSFASGIRRRSNAMGAEAKRAVVGVMRKLVLALYQVGAKGATFEVGRLFGSKPADLAEQGVGT